MKGGLVKSCCVVWINSLRCGCALLPDFCILSFTSYTNDPDEHAKKMEERRKKKRRLEEGSESI